MPDRKKPSPDTLLRFDSIELSAPILREDGTLEMEGLVVKPGVQLYRLPGGDIRRELIPKEELHDEASLATLRRLPLTMRHPPGNRITPQNVQFFQVGDTSDLTEVMPDDHVKIRIIARADRALKAIESGIRGLSAAYVLERLELTSGVHEEFGAYDAIQRGRRYNSVGLVELGRAGRSVRVRADEADAGIMVPADEPDTQPPQTPLILWPKDEPMNLVSIIAALLASELARGDSNMFANLTTAKGEAEKQANELAGEKIRADEAETALKGANGKVHERDGKITVLMKNAADAEQTRADEAESPEQRLAWFDERKTLLDLASSKGVKGDLSKLDNKAIQLEVVKTAGIELRGDEDEGYIRGMFKMMSETTKQAPDPRYKGVPVTPAKPGVRADEGDEKPLSIDPAGDAQQAAFNENKKRLQGR